MRTSFATEKQIRQKWGKAPSQMEPVVKNPPTIAEAVRDTSLTPGPGRSFGGRHGNPLQYCCLENPHGQRSLAGYSPWGCKESDITEALRTHFTFLALPFPVLFMKKCSPPVWSGTEDNSTHARGIHARNGMLESLWARGYSKGR